MNGSNIKSKKRKRMTKSKRNQLSHRLAQDQEKKSNGPGSSKKSDDSKDSAAASNYTLRSGKAVSHIPEVKDYKKQTAGTITQDRLIVPRQLLSLAKTKSSDWIKRGGLPESEAMKKKVDKDMKSMMEMAEQLRQGETTTVPVTLRQAESSATLSSATLSSATLDSANNISMDAVHASPPVIFANIVNQSKEPGSQTKSVESRKENSSLSITVTQPEATSTPHSAPEPHAMGPVGDASSSASSLKTVTEKEECKTGGFFIEDIDDIENKLLIVPVSQYMVKEPRSNCHKMFDNRDYGFEIRQELLQFWGERLCKSAQSERQVPIHGYNAIRPATHFQQYEPMSVLSSCRSSPSRGRTKHERAFAQAEQDDRPHYIFGTPADSGVESSIFLPSTSGCSMDSAQCIDPVIRICLNPEEMETDQEEDDYDSGLSLARMEEFFAQARRLEAEQNHLHRIKKQQSYGQSSQRPKDDWSSMLSHPPLKNEASDLFPKESSADRGESEWNSFMQSDHHNLPPLGELSEHKYLRHKEPWHPSHNINQESKRMKNDERYELSDTALSRYRLQSALNAACGQPTMTHRNDDDSGSIFSILDHDDQPEMDDLRSFPYARPSDPWAVSDLHSHQVDLQRQAHDFLSSHGGKMPVKSCLPFPGHSHHPRQIGSPDSNGSPVWLASSVLKDMML